ncbi:hypothetical protein RclHR1_09720004 [Rhizophagus clarus]|uniref:Uncharacterized protein n=1 Tax=Rhizophagus clarus TaxID=94130 RepID=A0A2Z6SJ37_9GLOM|nr:hypothetical protein RclHR1_09720004 [Rhizophagus clarus]GES72882.1 hypothetical protein GLOIN_2v1874039 [Rhizophagus clarus]
MQIDEQESYYYPLPNTSNTNNYYSLYNTNYYYPSPNIYQHDDFLYGLIYFKNPKTLQNSNNKIIQHFSYMDYLKKSETSIIPALKINNKVKNLKIALPLTNENDRANFMEPDQNFDEYNINNDDESFQKFQYELNKVKEPLISHSNLLMIKQERNYKIPNNLRWKPMNKQIEIIRQRKTNYKRPPVYRNKRVNFFEDTTFNPSQDTELSDTCHDHIPGLSKFNIWAPWKNKQEAYMAIDEFLRNAKQEVLEHLKSNPKF